METMVQTARKPEVDEAMRIFASFTPPEQRELVAFLRGYRMGRPPDEAPAVRSTARPGA